MHASVTSNKWPENAASPAHPCHTDIDAITHRILPDLRGPTQMNDLTDGFESAQTAISCPQTAVQNTLAKNNYDAETASLNPILSVSSLPAPGALPSLRRGSTHAYAKLGSPIDDIFTWTNKLEMRYTPIGILPPQLPEC